ASFRRELIDKVRALGSRRKRRLLAPRIAPVSAGAQVGEPSIYETPGIVPGASGSEKILLRPLPATTPRALLIGASTGGPHALSALLAGMGEVIDQGPGLLTQPMPPTFTAVLAEPLTRASERPASEAAAGEAIASGRVH